MRGMCCGTCGAEMTGEFTYYGYPSKDLLKMIQWLETQDAKVKDLEDATLDRHYWKRLKIHEHLIGDFK